MAVTTASNVFQAQAASPTCVLIAHDMSESIDFSSMEELIGKLQSLPKNVISNEHVEMERTENDSAQRNLVIDDGNHDDSYDDVDDDDDEDNFSAGSLCPSNTSISDGSMDSHSMFSSHSAGTFLSAPLDPFASWF